jgi:hypothetical protein
MLKFNYLKRAVDDFGNKIISDAKDNLNKANSNFSGNLNNSLRSSGVKFSRNSLELGITMNDYGAFIDKGVRGVGGVRKTTSTFKSTDNKGKMWKQKGGKSPFSYKEGVKPSVKHFVEWSNAKGLSPFAVREAVYHQGIAPTNFLSDAVKKNIPLLPKQISEAFAFDVQSTVDFIIKSNFKKK